MTGFYDSTKKLYTRYGLISERPSTPPDKSALFWALDTHKVYAVTDGMAWYEINPDFPAPEGHYHVDIGPFVTDIVTPNVLFIASSFGALVTKITIRVEDAYDLGVTCTVGDDADVDRFFETGNIDLQTPGEYVAFPNYHYSPGGAIKMRGSASSTTGVGTAFIEYDEATTHP